MKRIVFAAMSIFLAFAAIAQTPQGINYQCIVRDNTGAIIANHAVGIKFVMHQTNATGATAYSETASATTNQFGLVSLVIGQGTPTGTFSSINWSTGSFFLETFVDASGGTAYVSMGTQQLVSVPYALYAEKANEHQTLSLTGSQLSISSGNSVTLPSGGSGGGAMFQQTLIEDVGYFFAGSTSEPNVDSFLAVFGYYPGNNNNSASMFVVHKDAPTGTYEITGSTGYVSQCGGGNGVYITSATTFHGSLYYTYSNGCYGHTLSTLTGNVTYDVQPSSSNGVIFTDGQYMYVNNNANWLKYSVMGNQLTLVSTFVFSNTPTGVISVMCDGTSFFVLASGTLSKYDMSGTFISSKPVFGSPTGLADFDATRLYLLSAAAIPATSTTYKGAFTMTPISKP